MARKKLVHAQNQEGHDTVLYPRQLAEHHATQAPTRTIHVYWLVSVKKIDCAHNSNHPCFDCIHRTRYYDPQAWSWGRLVHGSERVNFLCVDCATRTFLPGAYYPLRETQIVGSQRLPILSILRRPNPPASNHAASVPRPSSESSAGKEVTTPKANNNRLVYYITVTIPVECTHGARPCDHCLTRARDKLTRWGLNKALICKHVRPDLPCWECLQRAHGRGSFHVLDNDRFASIQSAPAEVDTTGQLSSASNSQQAPMASNGMARRPVAASCPCHGTIAQRAANQDGDCGRATPLHDRPRCPCTISLCPVHGNVADRVSNQAADLGSNTGLVDDPHYQCTLFWHKIGNARGQIATQVNEVTTSLDKTGLDSPAEIDDAPTDDDNNNTADDRENMEVDTTSTNCASGSIYMMGLEAQADEMQIKQEEHGVDQGSLSSLISSSDECDPPLRQPSHQSPQPLPSQQPGPASTEGPNARPFVQFVPNPRRDDQAQQDPHDGRSSLQASQVSQPQQHAGPDPASRSSSSAPLPTTSALPTLHHIPQARSTGTAAATTPTETAQAQPALGTDQLSMVAQSALLPRQAPTPESDQAPAQPASEQRQLPASGLEMPPPQRPTAVLPSAPVATMYPPQPTSPRSPSTPQPSVHTADPGSTSPSLEQPRPVSRPSSSFTAASVAKSVG